MKMTHRLALAAALSAGTAAAVSSGRLISVPAPYRVTDLGPTGGNEEPDVPAVKASTATLAPVVLSDHPFLCQPAGRVGSTFRAYICGRTPTGHATGFVHDFDHHRDTAYISLGGTEMELGGLNTGGSSRAYAINGHDTVIGYSMTSLGVPHAFLNMLGGVSRDLGSFQGQEQASCAMDINDSGSVVGFGGSQDGRIHAFVLQTGPSGEVTHRQDLGTLGGANSFAYGISAGGQIVGAADTSEGRRHAFIYDGRILRDLNAMIPANSGWELTKAYRVNAHGQVVGLGLHHGSEHAFALVPAPRESQPSTAGFLSWLGM